MAFRLGSQTEKDDVIGAGSLRFTTVSSIASVFAAVVGAALPVLDKINAINISENLKIAMLGLVGAGVIGYAIASAGDVFARAYATAHVYPATKKSGDDNAAQPKPIAQYVVEQLVEHLDQLWPDVKTASSHTRHRTIFPLDGGLRVKTHLHDDCSVLALGWDDDRPEELLYLVARQNEAPSWKPAPDLEVVA